MVHDVQHLCAKRCLSVAAALALWALLIASAPIRSEPIAIYGYAGREANISGPAYNRERHVDPGLGRYTQRDPLGLAGGLNDYAYVAANPVNARDPEGLAPSDVDPGSSEARYLAAIAGTLPNGRIPVLATGLGDTLGRLAVALYFGLTVEAQLGSANLQALAEAIAGRQAASDFMQWAQLGGVGVDLRPVFKLAPKGLQEQIFARGFHEAEEIEPILNRLVTDRGKLPPAVGRYIVTIGSREIAATRAMAANQDLYVIRIGGESLREIIDLNDMVRAAGGRLRLEEDAYLARHFLLSRPVPSRAILGMHQVETSRAAGIFGVFPLLSDLINNPRYGR